MSTHVRIHSLTYVDANGRRVPIVASEGRIEPRGAGYGLRWWDDDGSEHELALSSEEYRRYQQGGQIAEGYIGTSAA